jgi:pimeloyl-ACP methyl ester carboxylesterase
MLKRTLALCTLMVGSPFARRSELRADEPAAEASPQAGRPNLVAPTLGGLQFWTDELFFHGWHIQRHCYTGHCRLLDDANRRHAWGTFEQCQARLQTIRRERDLPPMQGKAVIALHGLIRTRHSMNGLCQYLHDNGEYSVFNVNYPSTRAEVSQHAAALASIIEHLDGVEEINLISHSLGSLVIRHYLADTTDPETGRQGDPRIKRIVMMGPPNNGAELAEKLGRNKVFKTVFGAAGDQLARTWPELEARLAVPQCEFAIIAGGRGDASGWNPFLSGDDDSVVSVSTTRLPGARDFAVLPISHTFMMNDARLREYTLRFLQQGCFVAEGERQPIAAEKPSAAHQ